MGPRMWLRGGLGQAAVGRPAISFQVVNRVVIWCRYWAAVNRWRRGRKCGDIPLNADTNRCAPPGEVNFFIARSRTRSVGGSLGPVVQILRPTMLHAAHQPPLGHAVAGQLVSDQHPRHELQPSQKLAEEPGGGLGVTPRGDQDVQDIPLLEEVPQVVGLPTDLDEYLVEVPLCVQ
jgi:hypothetical protein